jgi:PAS domain-containing protein
MARHFTLPQITLLVGVALGVAALLVLVVYLIHRAVRDHRRGLEFKPSPPRTDNEPAFVAATVQALIAELKSRQTVLEERSRDAERRARSSARTLEAMARAFPQGLIVVSAEGYLTQANAPARELLQLDVWSHRRFTELLGDSPLAEAIRECLVSGKMQARENIEHQTSSGARLALAVRVEPIEAQGGTTEGAACLLWPL